MFAFRKANLDDSEKLTNLAVESESHWNRTEDFLEKFRELYKITNEAINQNLVFIISIDNKMIGFYNVSFSNEIKSLEHFFLHPDYIGMGFGKELWKHMIKKCRENHIKKIQILADPHAKDFYINMGAKYVGESPSKFSSNSTVPELLYEFKGSDREQLGGI
ncbi:MAG: GNAT family N-acetyltransferase [Spirochaetes bacterium]|jgi:N-acetylglutamate synthase-like GNAT family acetyltransferase|nr:GNAT family N-acetyltransferase [Spirochaetota bacterium]